MNVFEVWGNICGQPERISVWPQMWEGICTDGKWLPQHWEWQHWNRMSVQRPLPFMWRIPSRHEFRTFPFLDPHTNSFRKWLTLLKKAQRNSPLKMFVLLPSTDMRNMALVRAASLKWVRPECESGWNYPCALRFWDACCDSKLCVPECFFFRICLILTCLCDFAVWLNKCLQTLNFHF